MSNKEKKSDLIWHITLTCMVMLFRPFIEKQKCVVIVFTYFLLFLIIRCLCKYILHPAIVQNELINGSLLQVVYLFYTEIHITEMLSSRVWFTSNCGNCVLIIVNNTGLINTVRNTICFLQPLNLLIIPFVWCT